ncbi:MAG: NTP transferase domain-containing protein [Thermoanaerobacteraceae bacterium]|nr:NTP transferase domain-containing protein [Thermoanaerobacteraceae bacterium]
MQGIIMAGGAGSRLRPLTCDLPKPLVPLANRPVMSYAMDIFRDLGIKEVGVTLQYLPDKIKDYYGSGEDFGLNLSYFVEDSPLGTAGSVKNARNFLQDTFLVLSGDALTDFDLRSAIDFHRRNKALATLVLTRVSVPLEYGVVITDGQGRITRFLEKPGWSEVFSDTVNTGIYILEPEVLDYIPADSFFDFSKNLFPLLLEKGLGLYGYSQEGYWCDIGDLNQYRQAQYHLLAGNTRWSVREGREVKPGIWLGNNTVVEVGAKLVPPVLIGSDAYIASRAEVGPFSVVGEGVYIGGGSSVRYAVIWPEVHIKEGAEIRGAVIGKRGHVGAGARLFEGTALGDRVKINKRSTVKPGVLIWPEKEIGESQVVTENIVWGSVKESRDLLEPEQAMALGRAYANLWHKEVSALFISAGARQEHLEVLKNAAGLGIQATGLQALILNSIPLPLARYQYQKDKLPGIHLGIGEDGQVEALFFDAAGAYLDNSRRRKLKQLLQRREFKQLPPASWSRSQMVVVAVGEYLSRVSRNCTETVNGQVVAVTGLQLPYWQDLFAELGHRLVFMETRDGVVNALRQGEAHLGAEISANGDRLLLLDQSGNVLREHLLYALLTELLFHYNNGGQVVVPVTVAETAKKIAAKYDGEVRETKLDPVVYWFEMAGQEVIEAQPWLKQYEIWEDGYAQLLHVCDYLSQQNIELIAALQQLPLRQQDEKNIYCPWEVKGQVIRRLLEMYPAGMVDTTDGVKVNYPEGWALALPHLTRPEYRIIGEGETLEIARLLRGKLEQNIKSILYS